MGGTAAPADAGCISISKDLGPSASISEQKSLIAQAFSWAQRLALLVSLVSFFSFTGYLYTCIISDCTLSITISITNLCQSMPIYANLCQSMPIYANLCQSTTSIVSRQVRQVSSRSDDLRNIKLPEIPSVITVDTLRRIIFIFIVTTE
jgi:hypothetical protein